MHLFFKLENRICRQIQDLHASFWCTRVEESQVLSFGVKLPYLGMKLGIWKKVPEVAYGSSFYPRGSKLSLFTFYRQRFPRYGTIFKITIFGHETWNLEKVPEVAYGPSFYPRGSKLSLFSLYGQRFPRYGLLKRKRGELVLNLIPFKIFVVLGTIHF